jgi:ADP-ribose pyrophosphatase YjhB (NUDIX family)
MLRTAPTARYTELNTLFVESGHFRYHLQQLIKEGLMIQPTRGQYALSQKGMHAVDKLSLHAHNTAPMPKVITYILLTCGDTIVLQQKQKEPYMHLYNMIGGKVHEGETTQHAAVREVQEKTGLVIADPQHKGIYEIFIRQNNTLLTHAIAYVYSTEISEAQCRFAHALVVPKQDITSTKYLAPDFLPVYTALHSPQLNQSVISVDM